jgi:hypothetical protein
VSNNWTAPTSPAEAARRAGGRRHYNRWRQTVALIRRMKVSRLLRDRYSDAHFGGGKVRQFRWGAVKAIATELGVSPSTICRDLKELLRVGRPCSECGRFPSLGVVDALDVLEKCEEDARRGDWQWSACGPLPRHPERPAAESPGDEGSRHQ